MDREYTEVGKDGSRGMSTEAYWNCMVTVKMERNELFKTCAVFLFLNEKVSSTNLL